MMLHSIYPVVTFLPVWLAVIAHKARVLCYNAMGLELPDNEFSETEGVSGTGTKDRTSVSIVDTQIVILGLVSIILSGILVGREPGTLWPNTVWQMIFALCGLGILAQSTRLVRLARQQKH